MMVSARDSPFCTLVPAVLLNPITLPPSSWMAVSKLRRVRVEGSKKSDAMIRPLRRFWCGLRSKSSAISRTWQISSGV